MLHPPVVVSVARRLRSLPLSVAPLAQSVGFARRVELLARQASDSVQRVMEITPIPCLQDNYGYLLHCRKTNKAAVVDPVEPNKVLAAVKAAGADVCAIMTTHHHHDHAGGNAEFVQKVPGLAVYGFDQRVPAVTQTLTHNADFKVGDIHVVALHTPCHTSGSICYYAQSGPEKAVFTGDTLFVGGCGRFFEGTAREMHHALNVVLAALPPETKVYCGHEYTQANYKFALKVEPTNEILRQKAQVAESAECTVPSTIGDELKTNPFMRVGEPTVIAACNKKDPIAVMQSLRDMKNEFRG